MYTLILSVVVFLIFLAVRKKIPNLKHRNAAAVLFCVVFIVGRTVLHNLQPSGNGFLEHLGDAAFYTELITVTSELWQSKSSDRC